MKKTRNSPSASVRLKCISDSSNVETAKAAIRWFRARQSRLKPQMTKTPSSVYASRGAIDDLGTFTNRQFSVGEKIGDLALGSAKPQDTYTIEFNHVHRVVEEPWRYLNHGCEPNAGLVWGQNEIAVIALADILPHAEITIDYRQLPEQRSKRFLCRCRKCLDSGSPVTL